jgi:hypothetical protein
MKHIIFMGALVLASVMTGEAMAACSGTQITNLSTPTLTALLTGNSMCQTWPEVAQEQHVSGGVLQDYKRGPFDAVDPTTTIGSWFIIGEGPRTTVNYTYGSTSFYYRVFLVTGNAGETGSTYDFCTGNTVKATATFRPGFGSTSSYAPVCP